ncbi:MAG: hypothetical protein J6I65_05865 [Lachnospiraceae bacterium]|nr:hypothetical protein [Lachnospiraceae bacterium]
MKIAFWSNSRGMSGVTSNLACISALSSLMSGKKAVLFENHFDVNNLGDVLGIEYREKEILCEASGYGVSGMGNQGGESSHLREMFEEIVQECPAYAGLSFEKSVSYVNRHLYYLCGAKSYQEETREFFLQDNLKLLLSVMNEYMDIVYVDTASSHHKSSRIILQEADRVVVSLSQNPKLLDYFFRNFSDIRKKAFYIIGNYNAASEFDKEYIRREYNIPDGQLGVIPHSVAFADAMAKGRLLSFLQENLNCETDNPNFGFIKEAKESARKLGKDFVIKQKE